MDRLLTSPEELRQFILQQPYPPRKYSPIGELLVRGGVITAEQLERALRHQQEHPELGPLGQVLLSLQMLDAEQLTQTIAQQLNIPRVDLNHFDIDEHCLALVPEVIAHRYKVMPLLRLDKRLLVATTNPTQNELEHVLSFITGLQVESVLADAHELDEAIDRHYNSAILAELPESADNGEEDAHNFERIRQLGEDKPTVRFVNQLIRNAIDRRASDIHVLPGRHDVRILLRIDGVLVDVRRIKPGNLNAIVSRIKIIGGMDIAERRLPQDGRYVARLDERTIDLRLSVMPTVHGESVVIRVLDSGQSVKSLAQLGFSDADMARFRNLISHNQGILLVTGPTGSGKSTTLYAVLNAVRATGVNIITVEDPVEYQIDGIRQIQVKPQIGYTFARALRHILRHDPDVIMVGEIRDPETALMATESALTGHLVLSTLHTNSAASTLTRLLEIGIAPYLLSASLLGVLAQRLVRRNCPHCLAEEAVPAHLRAAMGLDAAERFYVGKGCEHCRGLGFAGRVAAYELLEITPSLRSLIAPNVTAQAIEQQAIRDGMTPLTRSALQLARSRAISLAEAYRVRLE